MSIYKRHRGASATAATIEAVPADVRSQRAKHRLACERAQRLEAAQAGLLSAQEAHERAKALVTITAAALEAAMARLAEIEAEITDVAA
jgi:hypothetical protein